MVSLLAIRNFDFCQHLSTLSPDLEVLTSVDTFGCRAPHGYKVRELSTAQSSRVVSQLSESPYDSKIGSVVAENEAKALSTLEQDFEVHPGILGKCTDFPKKLNQAVNQA